MQSNAVITLDLDGTLLASGNRIIGGDKTIELLHQLAAAGIKLAINTGRLDHDMIALQRQYDLTLDSRISQNGCVIVDDQHVQATLANKSEAQEVWSFLKQVTAVRTEVNTVSNRYWLTPRGPKSPREYYDSHVMVEDFADVITFQPVTLFLCLGPEASLQPVRKFVDTHCQALEAIMTSNSSLEIMPKGVSKGKTLRQAYPNEEIYAIGDSENDQSVLDIANQSYDVGTGTLVADFHVSGIDQALAMIAGGIA